MKDSTLVLNVIHGKELEVEYEKNQIIDKINSFFGYKYISNVTLKTVRDKVVKNRKSFPKLKNISFHYLIRSKLLLINDVSSSPFNKFCDNLARSRDCFINLSLFAFDFELLFLIMFGFLLNVDEILALDFALF